MNTTMWWITGISLAAWLVLVALTTKLPLPWAGVAGAPAILFSLTSTMPIWVPADGGAFHTDISSDQWIWRALGGAFLGAVMAMVPLYIMMRRQSAAVRAERLRRAAVAEWWVRKLTE